MKPSKYFFSRKNLIFVTVAVLLVYCLMWATVLVSREVHHRQIRHAAAVQQKQFDNQSNEQKSIIRAQEYLKSSIGKVGVEQRLMLDYLQRKYDLDESLGAVQSPFQITESPRTYPQEVNFLARISFPDKIVNMPPRSVVDGPALTNIYSANCDHMALPANFWPTMEQNYQAGGYSLTHVALALAFMKDNSCQIPTAHSDLRSKVIAGMAKLASNPATNPDLRYEAIAFLGLSGSADQIESAWTDSITTEQKKEGNWIDSTDPQNSDHTTVLALWALLEYSKPNVPYEPFIHHPAQQQ
jgi:hypothetical protein